jgi:hypothetical protein
MAGNRRIEIVLMEMASSPAREDESCGKYSITTLKVDCSFSLPSFYEGVVTVARAADAIVPIGTASHSKQVGA